MLVFYVEDYARMSHWEYHNPLLCTYLGILGLFWWHHFSHIHLAQV